MAYKKMTVEVFRMIDDSFHPDPVAKFDCVGDAYYFAVVATARLKKTHNIKVKGKVAHTINADICDEAYAKSILFPTGAYSLFRPA